MAYQESLAGVGTVSIVPSGTYPDPVVCALVDSVEWSYAEETSKLEDAAGNVIDLFTTGRTMEGSISLKDLPNSLIAAATNGVAVTTGSYLGYTETKAVPGSVAYTVDVTNKATFSEDLGVINLTAGKPMTCESAAADGAYSVASGTYTFHSAQASASVLINYRGTATTGTTASVAAITQGAGSYFQIHCYKTVNGKSWGLYIPKAKIPGISAKLSKKGYGDVTLKFTATLDDSGNVAYHYK